MKKNKLEASKQTNEWKLHLDVNWLVAKTRALPHYKSTAFLEG